MPELPKRIITGTLLALFGYWLVMKAPLEAFYVVLSAVIFPLMVWELLRLLKKRCLAVKFAYILYYLAIPLVALAYMATTDKMAILWLIAVVASTDIGAYIFGKNFGKTKIAPSISPNKSWEGLVGGMFCATLISYMLYTQMEMTFLAVAPIWLTLLTPILALCAQGGDFFESHLKRTSGLKDSSNILPGHGGLLDRFDGLLFVAPIVAALILCLAS